jgi:osmotically-inducible protein OsmY
MPDTTATSHSHEGKPTPATTDDKSRDASVLPDNTKVNQRDTKSSALTPLDQGEGQADLDITKRIRQAVVGDGSLSFTAKNVKIITRAGKVTLRGPVNTVGERTTILAAAQKVAGASNVDNQLEVAN